jgi:hypothetical protein
MGDSDEDSAAESNIAGGASSAQSNISASHIAFADLPIAFGKNPARASYVIRRLQTYPHCARPTMRPPALEMLTRTEASGLGDNMSK